VKETAEDRETRILDEALDAAENVLAAALPKRPAQRRDARAWQLSDAFKRHIETHLLEEMGNIACHGDNQEHRPPCKGWRRLPKAKRT
jgi:hypothetical protein